MAGDRIDVLENRIEAVGQGRPDNLFSETGVLREFKSHAYRARCGQHRADLTHQPLDLVLWTVPYLAMAASLYVATRAVNGRRVAQ